MTCLTAKPNLSETVSAALSVADKQVLTTQRQWLGFAVCVQDENGNAVPFRVDMSGATPKAQVLKDDVWTDLA